MLASPAGIRLTSRAELEERCARVHLIDVGRRLALVHWRRVISARRANDQVNGASTRRLASERAASEPSGWRADSRVCCDLLKIIVVDKRLALVCTRSGCGHWLNDGRDNQRIDLPISIEPKRIAPQQLCGECRRQGLGGRWYRVK